jgi:hypothetical protein
MSQRLNAPPEIRTSHTRETPAFFDANPELKEAYRTPVKNLPAEQQERAMTTIAARVLHTVMAAQAKRRRKGLNTVRQREAVNHGRRRGPNGGIVCCRLLPSAVTRRKTPNFIKCRPAKA